MIQPSNFSWFREATYGLFIHWGPYSIYERGEQVLMRELVDQSEYAQRACAWNPSKFDAKKWAQVAVDGGYRYAVLTTRHHDGFCLWDSQTTNYTSVQQSAGRDFVREYVEAFRAAGLKVGLYFSWNDFRIPAMFEGPKKDPEAWAQFIEYVHAQLRELMTNYGKIDILWFDGVWPADQEAWGSEQIIKEIRQLQPGILINNRLGFEAHSGGHDEFGANESEGGDFGTPENHIVASPGKLWEACQVSTWRLWSYCPEERWHSADRLLDMITDASSQGGNFLLNVGPNADGEIPQEFIERSNRIGQWLKVHGEAFYGTQPVAVGESTLFGRQTRKGNTLYLILRFWHGSELRFQGLETKVLDATLLTNGQSLVCEHDAYGIALSGLPEKSPDDLFPVIKLELDGEPESLPCYEPGMWCGEPERYLSWVATRGRSGFDA